jgi:Arc/MetJ family transcription regulator
VRDHGLSLACVREGLPPVQARSYDDLPAETIARFEGAHVGAVEPRAVRAALAASVLALLREGAGARLPHASVVAERLADFAD